MISNLENILSLFIDTIMRFALRPLFDFLTRISLSFKDGTRAWSSKFESWYLYQVVNKAETSVWLKKEERKVNLKLNP